MSSTLTQAPPPLPLVVRDLLGRVQARQEFSEFAGRAEPRMDQLEGAFLIAREEYPHLDSQAYRLRVQGMAEAVKQRVRADMPRSRALAALNDILFQEEGFHGDKDEYYDPRNSYINQVIDRRRGIPITLSLLYLDVGRRAGLPLEGVNFPGHFLVACREPGRELLIDPFEEGRSISLPECEARLRAVQGSEARLDRRLLQPAGPRQILYRVLNNLKGIYMKTGELGRALACIERMLLLVPDSPVDRRDRGVLLLHLDFPELARRDFEAYLLHEPDTQDAGPIFEHLKTLQRRTRHTS